MGTNTGFRDKPATGWHPVQNSGSTICHFMAQKSIIARDASYFYLVIF